MKKILVFIFATLLANYSRSQCNDNVDSLIKTASRDNVITYRMKHDFKLTTDNIISPKIFTLAFNHAWAKESGCSIPVFIPTPQYINFNNFGLNVLGVDSNITNNGNPVKWESYQIENPDTIYEAHANAGSCHSHSHANSCVAIGSAEFASGCSGVIQNYGLAQAISDSTCRAEAYSFSVAGVTVVDDKDLLKGNIDWEAFFECGKKGKGHTIIQKSGSNDPINFYIKDSITGKDTLGTLLSIHFSFYTGLDTLTQLNYWRNDTVHIESDSSEFKIIYPSNLTSLNGSLIINVNGGMVSSIVKTGNYSTFNQVQVGQFLPLHFYLNDSLHFHYNLDSMQLLNSMGINNQDSLHVRLFMFGNCENNYAMDTTQINLAPVVVNATCANVANGVISVTATLGHAPYTYVWSNGATTATATGLAEGTYTVIVTDVIGCTASSVNIITAPNALSATCTSTNVTCNIANNGTASVSSSGGSGNSSYSWSNGSTGTFVSGLSQGTYTVTVTDANGCTNTCTSVITSTGTPPALPGFITGTTSLCRNTLGNTFSILPVAGATSYTWTLGAGAIITQGQGGTVITFSLTGSALPGMVSVTASNVCGTSTSSNLNYTVNSIPGAPSTISGQTSGVCNKPNVPYSTAMVPSATSYFWTVPTGANIMSGQGSNAVMVSFSNSFTGTGNITVKAVNTCGMSAARTLALNAKPQSPIISGLNYACKNQPGLHYTVAPVAGATSYTWTVVAGSIIVSGQGTPQIVVNWGNINGIITCKANNSCGSSAASNLAVAFTCKNENETIDPNSISLYPNPGKGRITLQYESYTDGEMEMGVYELTGKIIFNKKLVSAYGNNKHEIDFANLSSGIYLVQLKVDGTNKWMKLIIND